MIMMMTTTVIMMIPQKLPASVMRDSVESGMRGGGKAFEGTIIIQTQDKHIAGSCGTPIYPCVQQTRTNPGIMTRGYIYREQNLQQLSSNVKMS